MKHKFLFLFAAMSLLPAYKASALTFEESIQSAETNSHELKALKLETQSARWSETKAFAGFLPKLSFTGRHLFAERFEELEIDFGGATVVMPAIQPYTSFGFTASMEVFSGFKNTNEWRAAQLSREASEHRLKRAEEAMRANVRTLFYKALGAQVLVDVADQNIKTLESHLSDVTSRIRSGVATRYDSLRVEVQLEDAKTEKYAADSSVVVARAKLFEALGIADDGKPLIGKLPEDFTAYEKLKEQDEETIREDRVAQSLEIESARHLSKAAKAHWVPKVSVFGNHEWYNNINHYVWEEGERFKPASSVGVLMTWNLFDGGASYASQKQALLAEQIKEERLRQFDEAAPIELEEAKRRFSYQVINYKAKARSVQKAEEAVRLAKGGVRAGTRTNTETLDAVVDLNRAKASSVKAQIDAIEALGQLQLAKGSR